MMRSKRAGCATIKSSTMIAEFKSPLHILEDSGVPTGSTDYTTVVLVHGFTWHSGTFKKLIPLAHSSNARVVLVNRGDYLGSKPLTETERALLPSIWAPGLQVDAGDAEDAEIAAAKEKLETFMAHRARELHDLLVELVQRGGVLKANHKNNKGGIIIAGWSLGGSFMNALLAHVASIPVGDVKLSDFMRRVVLLDTPVVPFGLSRTPKNTYSPMFDPSIAEEDRQRVFNSWVSGYYQHGDTLQGQPLLHPPPTISTLTPEEIASLTCEGPGAPGGSDEILMHSGARVGLFKSMRERALYLPGGDLVGDPWQKVEVRFVACENSIPSVYLVVKGLQEEIEEANVKGLPMRDVRIVRVQGANHFVRVVSSRGHRSCIMTRTDMYTVSPGSVGCTGENIAGFTWKRRCSV
ncbi:hypothetical protein C2E23DRAFT_318207 [Lenzites betulinus]|nr:hypothetical protein C2E23DRAFT_318207 [Lenzites betulinus]